jgi:hypothetical protein
MSSTTEVEVKHYNPAPRVPRSFYGPAKYRWAIYPDYWKDSWGPLPLLGHVWADSEFEATRTAYDKKLLTVNFTIAPKAVRVPNPTAKW